MMLAPAPGFLRLSEKKLGYNDGDFDKHVPPREDYFSVTEDSTIFAVADGVTMIWEGICPKDYPNPSPPGEVAKLFCDSVVGLLKEGKPAKEAFILANEVVKGYNYSKGRIGDAIDYGMNDLIAVTGAIGSVKDSNFEWVSISDSLVLHFDGDMQVVNRSIERLNLLKHNLQDNWNEKPIWEKTLSIRRDWRNALSKDGRPIGYGVVTGEEAAFKYIDYGEWEIKPGDTIAIATDGFEPHLRIREFVDEAKGWDETLEARLRSVDKALSDKDPDTYGHERTLIMVRSEG